MYGGKNISYNANRQTVNKRTYNILANTLYNNLKNIKIIYTIIIIISINNTQTHTQGKKDKSN